MRVARKNILRVAVRYQPLFRQIGLDADTIFSHQQIRAWRTLRDRENCTLDYTARDGESIRWHIKRYAPARYGLLSPAQREMNAFHLLDQCNIPTATLVGWGTLIDGRSFLITEDLDGFDAADKLIRDGAMSFNQLLEPTADLAAKLHASGLHHRDLYLCHFFARAAEASAIDLRLIDVARLRKLTNPLTRRRWIVKDLSQFWFSTSELSSITNEQRETWLARYASQRRVDPRSLRSAIERKSRWIARHDQQLRTLQPNRNISIPR